MAALVSQTDIATMQAMLHNLLSSDNNVRIKNELDFKHALESNPSIFTYTLCQIGLNSALDLSIRQSALLQIKRVVPKYWSPAFDKFVGPVPINQDTKSHLRTSLLSLLCDPDSKIRSSTAYAIVQIAAVDYPDEWPDVLTKLYGSVSNPNSSVYEIIGSLTVIQEIFDDVVSEQQFYEHGVSIQVLNTCQSLLSNGCHPLPVKIETMRLLRILSKCFDALDTTQPDKEEFVNEMIPKIISFLLEMAKDIKQGQQYELLYWEFKFELYLVLIILIEILPDHLLQISEALLSVVMSDLNFEKDVFSKIVTVENTLSVLKDVFTDLDTFKSLQRENLDPMTILSKTISKQLKLLQIVIEYKSIGDFTKIQQLLDTILPLTILPSSKIEEYNVDFNQFITDESGLNPEVSVRESAREVLTEMNEDDNFMCINALVERLQSTQRVQSHSLDVEAIVYLMACCFDNDDTIVDVPSFAVSGFLENVINIIKDDSFLNEDSQFLMARLILMVPKFIFKFTDQAKAYANPTFDEIISIIPKLGASDEYMLIKAAILFSFQYYNYIIRAKEFDPSIQFKLLGLIDQLKDDSEEDANMMLLEVLTIIISIDNVSLSASSNTLELILTIGFKQQTNFSMNTSLFECVEDLIKDIPEVNYVNLVNYVFPHLNDKIAQFNGEFDSQIDLSLEVLTRFFNDEKHQLPKALFDQTFTVLTGFLLVCNDDQLLQSGSETLVSLVKTSPQLCESYQNAQTGESGTQILLKSLSKFLSPELSDRAIVNLGDLARVILDKFGNSVHEFLPDILKALTVRLIKTKEVPTIENMILIFNSLAIQQPTGTIDFLKSFNVENSDRSALYAILPIWFEAYEVMRGFNSIISNVRAFIEIFKLHDEAIQNMVVDGDALANQFPEGVIVTRSIAKNTPIKYEQIPADCKIVKLLIEELKNEMAAKPVDVSNVIKVTTNQHPDDDEEGWEDLEDVEPSFDQLKSYVDNEDERGAESTSDDMKQILLSFFKECTTTNTSRFEYIYNNYLSESQKSTLSEYLAFT